MKLLLINPRFPDSFWGFSWTFENVFPERQAVIPPLGLATVAALSPRDWEVRIVDENVEPIDFSEEADVVGVGGMSIQHQRQRQILAEFRRRGRFTVAGGAFASLCPEEYEGVADSLVSGEAEYIWPQFCEEYLAGRPQAFYREDGVVSLEDSPTPRFDLIRWPRYVSGSIQFSRGCPFQCEFCDIIITFGRKPRTKPLDQIRTELDALREHGVRNVVFVDDNLVGDIPQARRLLEFLCDYQTSHDYEFSFGSEASINLTSHPELLALLGAANFAWLFIGIESPDAAALEETRKTQNTRRDLVAAVHSLYDHGVEVFGGFIVGFDADDRDVFERQFRFIMDAGIIIAMVGLLYAPPKTPLYQRLAKEDRLLPEVREERTLINAGGATNVIPLQMTGAELAAGCRALHLRLLSDANIGRRIAKKLRRLQRPRVYAFPPGEWWTIMRRLVLRGVLPGGPRRWLHFLLSMLHALRRPEAAHRRIAVVVSDWSMALSLRAYAERLEAEAGNEVAMERRVEPVATQPAMERAPALVVLEE